MAKTMQWYLQSSWVVLVLPLGTEEHRKEMAQAAKLLAGVLCSSPLKLITNPGRFPVPRTENIMAMQGRTEEVGNGTGKSELKSSQDWCHPSLSQRTCRRVLLLCA